MRVRALEWNVQMAPPLLIGSSLQPFAAVLLLKIGYCFESRRYYIVCTKYLVRRYCTFTVLHSSGINVFTVCAWQLRVPLQSDKYPPWPHQSQRTLPSGSFLYGGPDPKPDVGDLGWRDLLLHSTTLLSVL